MIRYKPNLDSILWSFKCIEYFDNFDDLKAFISDQRTRFCHAIGRTDRFFHARDVHLSDIIPDPFLHWKNYRSVVIDGITVGFCGE
jgi:phosphatidylserine/phosphatidylglycerophosphate/cardiolipin synthase-like enzyme